MSGLFYNSQFPFAIVGTKTAAGVRSGWTLAATYGAEGTVIPTKTFKVGGMSKLNIDFLYTMGATETANTIETKIESSPDGINFYRIPNESVSGGTSTITAREFTFLGADATTATNSIGIDIFYKYVRVSFKETGVVTNFGNVYAEATVSGQ